jgi:hypothetical protein
MSETMPTIEISDAQPLETVDYRDHDVFRAADPLGEVPDVSLTSAPPNPRDRPRPHKGGTRVGINDLEGERVGALNLLQVGERSWINDVEIPERKGERLGVASYLGIIAALHTTGRQLESDPQGLSKDSIHVWDSLARRGVAQTTGEQDVHGYPRFVSRTPNVPS